MAPKMPAPKMPKINTKNRGIARGSHRAVFAGTSGLEQNL
jgi:hypothetical protein